MFITYNQIVAGARNTRRDAEFFANPEKVAKHERDMKEYEDFCRKYGPNPS